MDELAVGATFADHVIRGVAGRGGMGIVYRALHVPLKREVALKVLAAGISTDEEFRTRFRHEFEAAASIQHPNVIPIYHAGEQDGLLYVTMRYVDGTDLARLIAVETRLDPIRAAVIIGQVAAALDAAHRAGLVHRDVKPANVLIEAPGRERARAADRLRADEVPALRHAGHAGGHARRHLRLHRARAAQRAAGRRPHRRLRARLRALPGAHRPRPVPARHARGQALRPPRVAAAVGHRARARGPARRSTT